MENLVKKSLSILLLLLFTILCACNGGSSKNDISFHPELVNYNLIQDSFSHEFSFNVTVSSIMKLKENDFEFVSAKGVGTDDLKVSFSIDNWKELKSKIKGYYIYLLGLHFKSIDDYTKIDEMTIKVAGFEEKLKFQTPVQNTFYDIDEEDHFLNYRNVPNYIFCDSLGEQIYLVSLNAGDDLLITEASFMDFLKFDDAEVFIDGKSVGALDSVLPLSLKSGQSISISSTISRADGIAPFYGTIMTDMVFKYKLNNKNHTDYFPLSAVFIGNRDDAVEFVENVVIGG